jgi:hypothetical protein
MSRSALALFVVSSAVLFGGPAAPVEAPPAAAPPTPSPTVAELVQRHVAALGGSDALAKVRSRVMKGTTTALDRGAVGATTIYQRAPASYALVSEFPMYGTVKRTFDGERGWSESPDRGLVDLGGTQLALLERSSRLDFDSAIEQLYPGLVVVGRESLDGSEVWTARAGDGTASDTLHFDVASGLLAGTVHEETTPQGAVRVETRWSDYRAVDGVKVPFATLIQTPAMRVKVELAEVRLNEPIDDQLFRKPAPAE